MREKNSLSDWSESTLPTKRMINSEKIQKMARIAQTWNFGKQETNGKRKTSDSPLQQVMENIGSKNFPALGLDKTPEKGKFVMIKFEDEEKSIHDAHPIQLGQVLKQYFNGHSSQQKIKNALLVKTKDERQFETISKLKEDIYLTVGGHKKKVIFEEQKARNQSRGVVFDKGWNELSPDEIKLELQAEGFNIREVRQMVKKDINNDEKKTGTCVITFDCPEPPEKVKMCGIIYNVRKYYPNPLICSKCLEFGHIKAKCPSKNPICRKCGNEYEEGGSHQCGKVKCPNCKEDESHVPNGPDCGTMELEKLVVQYRVNNSLPYQQAREAVSRMIMQQSPGTALYSQVHPTTSQSSSQLSAYTTKSTPLQEIENELRTKSNELTEMKKLRMELEKVNRQLKEEYEHIIRLKHENEKLKRMIMGENLKSIETTGSDDVTTKRALSDGEDEYTGKLTKLTYTINNAKKQPPTDSEELSDTDFGIIAESFDKKAKEKAEAIKQKALNKFHDIKWYRKGESLTPVEVKLSSQT